MYTAASKFTLMHICILLWGLSFILNLNVLITHKTDDGTMSNSTIVAAVTVGVVIMLLISAALSWIIKQYFPAIVFYLGGNIKSVEKKSKTKSNIFWCIIVAGIVSVIVDKNNFIYTKFLYYWLNSFSFINQVKIDVGGTAYNALTIDMLKNYLIPLPPLEEQKRIVAKIEELLPFCDQLIK